MTEVLTYEALEAERDALAQRVEMLAQNLGNAIWGEQEALQRVNALAMENAALKAINDDRRMFIMNGVQLGYIKVPTVEVDPALETIRIAVSPQVPTPATSAALAAIRDEATARALKHLCDCQLISATVAELKADELREGK